MIQSRRRHLDSSIALWWRFLCDVGKDQTAYVGHAFAFGTFADGLNLQLIKHIRPAEMGVVNAVAYMRLIAMRARALDFSIRTGSSRIPPTLMRKKVSPFRT